MTEILIGLFVAAVLNGAPLLYGTLGEILTEKSGNLNLGVEGMMFVGGACGLGAAFYYERALGEAASGQVAVLLSILVAFLAGALCALIYSFLVVSLRANQNVTGLALTIFGTGVGQFIGEYMTVNAGGFVALSNNMKVIFQNSPFPTALQEIPILGEVLFSFNFFVYFGFIIAIVMTWFLNKTRLGLNLRSVGESPSTADAAGINVTLYKYAATTIGGGISAVGGMVYIMTIAGCVWSHEGLSGVGWLAVAVVIFCLWKPMTAAWGSVFFGALLILYLRVTVPVIPTQIYKILPYVVTILVLIVTSMRNSKDKMPPKSLGLSYFREER